MVEKYKNTFEHVDIATMINNISDNSNFRLQPLDLVLAVAIFEYRDLESNRD